jgi:group I intron endonuclease
MLTVAVVAPTVSFAVRPETWRKDLIREVPQIAGVYRIRNVINGKAYVGSAKNIRRRWRKHLVAMLEGSTRGQPRLINACKKYGGAAFVFDLLERIEDESALLSAEQSWMDRLGVIGSGYNIRLKAHSNIGLKPPPLTEEGRRRIGAATSARLRGIVPGQRSGIAQPVEARLRQSRTRRDRSKMIEFDGKRMCLADWADSIGISHNGLQNRLARGWPLSRALTEVSRGY